MTRQTVTIIGLLAAATLGLSVALGVVLATDDDGPQQPSRMMDGQDAFMGMMMSMSEGDSDSLLQHMRDVLGDDGFARMTRHFGDHRDGTMSGDSRIDGMMQHMPADSRDRLPRGGDQHHTPGAGPPSD